MKRLLLFSQHENPQEFLPHCMQNDGFYIKRCMTLFNLKNSNQMNLQMKRLFFSVLFLLFYTGIL